jgi:23S rRNA (adenine2030-N6)-methyltransferase
MNYRHSFHAGNVADVFKHIVLLKTLELFRAKDSPLCVVDTHAGSGLYRLKPPGEYEQGVGRLWPARAEWPALDAYFARLAAYNGPRLETYPGSPVLIADMLRPQDRAVFVESQPQEAAALRDHLRGRPHVAVHEADGFAMLKALVPPRENRGLVLIDPPFEKTEEFAKVAKSLEDAVRRWRNGVFLAWYPIKARRPVERFHADVSRMASEAWAVEFMTLPDDVAQRLNGSGMVLINPPWKLREWLAATLEPLAAFLAGPGGQPQVRFVELGTGK